MADEELSFKKPVERNETARQFRDVGWWTDRDGYKHYGVIPQNEKERNEYRRFRERDSWIHKEVI